MNTVVSTLRLNERQGAIAVAACALALALIAFPPPSLDDAYIAVHSAQVLLSGHDSAFDAPALSGITSPPYVAALAALLAAGAGPVAALRVMAAISFAVLLTALWLLGERLPIAARGAVVTLAAASLWIQAGMGLETMLVLAVLLFALWACRRDRPLLVALACGLLPALRPDTALAAGALWLFTAWSHRVRVVPMLALSLATVLPWMVWLHADLGTWWPSTLHAKQVFYAEDCWPLQAKVQEVFRLLGIYMLGSWGLWIGAAGLRHHPLGRLGLIVMTGSSVAYGWLFPTAYIDSFERYPTVMLAPWLLFGLVLSVERARSVGTWVATLAGVTLAVAATIPALPGQRAVEMVGFNAWTREHLPQDAVVLVHDAGNMAALSPFRLVDLVGLKTSSSVETHARITYPSCGRKRAEAVGQIARASHARYAAFNPDADKGFHFSEGVRAAGATLSLLRAAPANANGYSVFQIDWPEAN